MFPKHFTIRAEGQLDISISGRHMAVTDAMRAHARERAEKSERVCAHIARIDVTLSLEGERHMAEAVAVVRRKGEVVARAESHDMYASIDHAFDKLEKQLQKLEERIKDRREAARSKNRRSAGSVTPEPSEEDE